MEIGIDSFAAKFTDIATPPKMPSQWRNCWKGSTGTNAAGCIWYWRTSPQRFPGCGAFIDTGCCSCQNKKDPSYQRRYRTQFSRPGTRVSAICHLGFYL